jgi:hypothetical protein
MIKKRCENCGEIFITKSERKKYCSKECRREATKKLREANEQPCWRCERACGGCTWSKNGKPVDGWEATPTIIRDYIGDFPSYKITYCPEFIKG